jgi:adenine-specific DNA-methyltransferase
MNTHATPAKFPLSSMDIAEEKRRQMKQLFPEAFTETRDAETGELKHAVDWDKLKASLGEVLEKEGERFGLSWPGKSGLLKIIQQPSVGTLKPCREESVKFDETENLFIEGDNLEVLKLLQKSYFGKVKMIYIDPPYNTGNEFVYPDNFTETLETYLQYTGQVDAQGRKFSTNSVTEGRFHSKWLNMMYPRLFLARNLLREDGIICISIDDNEVEDLKLLCNEIYGEENFLANICWQKRYVSNVTARWLSDMHDFVLVYAVSRERVSVNAWERSKEQLAAYKNPDNDSRGQWRAQDLSASKPYSAGLFTIKGPTGLEFNPPPNRYWRCNEKQFNAWKEDNRIWWGVSRDARPMLKSFLSESERGITPHTWWDYNFAGHNKEATLEVKELFDGSSPFDTPKPAKLIRKLLELFAQPHDAILDFFSGSCSTAHAVLDLNKEDGGNRKFIMVQLPEPCDEKSEAFKAGYKTIADIGKERIRRVIQKIEKEQEGQLDLDADKPMQDLGFKVFKLSESNFNTWQGDETAPEKLKDQLEMHINHLDPQATSEAILYELLLKAGFPLTTKVAPIRIADKSAYSIAEGALIICLDSDLDKPAIQAIAALKPVQCICLDAAFSENDQLKTNAVQTMEAAKVQFRTV